MSSSGDHLENFKIPLEEILLATQNFSPETRISHHSYADVYRGQLQNRTVAIERRLLKGCGVSSELRNELKIVSTIHHKNVISFVAYCHEDEEVIRVSEYAVNGCLFHYFDDPNKRRSLTWVDRLKICIGAAKGLEYLHSGLGEDTIGVHRDVDSRCILLGDNLEAKIRNFEKFILLDRNQPQDYYLEPPDTYYEDPLFELSGTPTTEADVYSFGVILFEMLSGMLANDTRRIDGYEPQPLINLVIRHYADGLFNLIDPDIRDQIKMRSFKVFKETAYQCISWNINARPSMDMIVKRIEEALDFQNDRASSTIMIRSLQDENLERFRIPLRKIHLATDYFDSENIMGKGRFGKVYKGQLYVQPEKRPAAFGLYGDSFYRDTFVDALKMMSIINHENIINFIGFCDEDKERVIVSEFASNGSLADRLIRCADKSYCLTWAERMNICVGAARAFEYLHSGIGENRTIIHGDVKSANILLDHNLDAKIDSFHLSLLVGRNEQQVYQHAEGSNFYIDPVYFESGMVNTGSDVYSFGVVLFEVLCGMTANSTKIIDDGLPQPLIKLVKRYYDDGLDKIIDPNIKDQINGHSLYTFKKIAYRCISTNSSDRPTMKRILKRFEYALKYQDGGAAYNITTRNLDSYQIPLNEIILATDNFNRKTSVGEGGFGVVYKGKLSQSWQNCTIAIKRLDPKGHQGKKEFHAELNLISRFHHPNIIPFVGYCDEQDQMIIVYEYAANKSLDYYLVNRTKMRTLTWTQRLNICLGAAKGLDYLHSGLGKHHRVIHRDVKSGNILLDENLEAKICDFGLSTEVPGAQESSQIFIKVAGTNFYLDPIYYGSGVLRKESDIYSFGVVLFEILSGRPAYYQIEFVDGNPQYLINLVRRYYENAPENLIDPDIKDHIGSRSFDTFKEIAYQCISFISAERPTMDTIIALSSTRLRMHLTFNQFH